MSGWRRLHDYLRAEGEGPFLKVFRTCPNTVRTLPALTYSKTRSEDVDTAQEDHCADMIRYFLMSRQGVLLTTPASPEEPGDDPRWRSRKIKDLMELAAEWRLAQQREEYGGSDEYF
jgi:hypothetical protein